LWLIGVTIPAPDARYVYRLRWFVRFHDLRRPLEIQECWVTMAQPMSDETMIYVHVLNRGVSVRMSSRWFHEAIC